MKNHLEEISIKFKDLQKQVCAIIENSDGSGSFTEDTWQKDIGYGITRVLSDGKKIKKGAVNFSKVSGRLSKNMKQALGVESDEFSATGISSIFHANNPFVPTIHMNVRYFALNNGMEWFGGGIDLTPVYIDTQETKNFHQKLKATCDKFDSSFYNEFKVWADNYFFLPHRNETRGVGGIFFDRQQPTKKMDYSGWFNFTQELATLYPVLYAGILEKSAQRIFTKKNKNWQKKRWGRYVEFNLIYDRGTKFGLESGGYTESILISMPPEASWAYTYTPEINSEEEKTQQLLKKGIDWINYPDTK